MSGLISVITPVYNAERDLPGCLDSLLGQSHRDLEIILVDDGSTDGSASVCRSYAARDGRITVLARGNGGPADARNAGLRRASGEFVFFLDSDDRLEPEALERLVEHQRRHSSDLTASDFRKVGDDGASAASGHGSFFAGSAVLLKPDIAAYARRYARTPYGYVLLVHCWGKLYLSRIIKEHGLAFDAGLHNFEDVAFNFGYLGHVERLVFVDEVLYHYRVRGGSQSYRIGDDLRHFTRYRKAFDAVEAYLDTHAPGSDAKAEAGHLYISCVIMTLLRTCAGINERNREEVRRFVSAVVDSEDVRRFLPFYSPSGRDSRLVALLMRLRLVRLIMLVCRRRFRRHMATRFSQNGGSR